VKRLFGTDGIRSVAGQYPLDAPTVRRFGAALAGVLARTHGRHCRVVLGRDTRESGAWLAGAVTSGLLAGEASVVDAGTITTPGLAHVLEGHSFDAGVMISASHNPFQDNGLKVFGPGGFKLSDELERRVEERMLDETWPSLQERTSGALSDPRLVDTYVEHLQRVTRSGCLRGLRLVLDCANGSAASIAPPVFRRQGAEVQTLGDAPDGRNINLDCGSQHLERLARAVVESGADLGVAFDGDADRCQVVDRRGRRADGDHVLYISGRRLQRLGLLRGNAIVATIMSNLWLERALAALGIALHRTAVGDKYVLERMLAEDLVLGGEQSGHVIFREHATTGDGILTALLFLETLVAEGEPLEQILDAIEPCPQVLLNVRVRQKTDLLAHEVIGPAVREVQRAMGDAGRVVLRYSGTEPVVRIMVEGTDAAAVEAHARHLAGLVSDALGPG
jgi:phosphoglucosamine mutase